MKTRLVVLFGFVLSSMAIASYPDAFKGSEITGVLDSNGGKIPTTLEAMHSLVEGLGPMTESIVPFSDSPLFTSLYEPRIVVSHSPKFYYTPIPRLNGTTDFEFLSWNNSRHEFDFGRIVDFGKASAHLETVDANTCIACHRNRGPLFSDRPWLNVTGANAPIGTYLSMAILQTMIDADPDRYGRYREIVNLGSAAYDESFGNLAPEPAIPLGSILFHGTPLFQLRGSFDLDANTRRGHYLVYTHQILQALPGDQKGSFSETLVEKALFGVVYPEYIETLFAWDQYLDQWVGAHPELNNLPARTSPVLKNYQPLFHNATLLQQAGISNQSVDEDPVSALVKLGKYVQANQIKAYPPEELPSSGNAFIPLKPNHNGGADTALSLLVDMKSTDAGNIRKALKGAKQSLSQVFASDPWRALWASSDFPSRNTILTAIATSLQISPDTLVGAATSPPVVTVNPNQPVPLPIPTSELKNHTCLICHNSGPDGMARAFPFDPAKLDAWKAYLENPATHDDGQHWIDAAYTRLSQQLMPPPDSDQAKGFSLSSGEWKAIYDYLAAQRTKS